MTYDEQKALVPGDRVIFPWCETATVTKYRFYGTMQWFPALRFEDGEVYPMTTFRPEDMTKL